MKYFIRAIKYFFYFAILFAIVVSVIFFTSKPNDPNITILDLFKEGSGIKIIIFFIAVAAIYPLLGFTKKDIYSNVNLKEKKKEIIDLFENANFILTSETESSMTFRLKNKVLRIVRMCEDAITIDFSDNPAKISGLRKDVLRFSRGIEYLMRDEAEK